MQLVSDRQMLELISDKRMFEYSEVMRRGNLLLKSLARSLGMNSISFRAKLFKEWSKGNFSEWKITPEQERQIREAMPAIAAVRDLEGYLLAKFEPFAVKLANKWSKMQSEILDVEDYRQEIYMAISNAVYGYTNLDCKFITYLWHVAHNRCVRALTNSRLCKQPSKLMAAFERTKARLSASGLINDEQVIELMDLGERQATMVRRMLPRVVHMSQFDSDGKKFDYESPAKLEIKLSVDEMATKANLNDAEREVLIRSLSDSRGWETDMARQCNITRAGISFRYRKAIKKIGEAFANLREAI